MDQDQLRQHVTILGWLHVAAGMLFVLCGAFVFCFFTGIGLASHDQEALPILATIGTTVGGFLVLLSLPGLAAGYGLLQRRVWGRILAIVVGFLNLINVPIGTVLGIYTLWVLLSPPAEAYFEPAPPPASPPDTPVPQ